MATDLEATVQGILTDPQRNFPRFLFESDTVEVVELLSALIVTSKHGYQAAVECLWCWQDLMECTYGLSPVLDEVDQTQDLETAVRCVQLLGRLLEHAPDAVRRIRMRQELTELNAEQRIESMRERLGPDNRLEESVVSWKQLYQQHEPLSLNVDSLRCIDTDSGTYSGEDEDDMVATSDGGSSTDQQIDSHANGTENGTASLLSSVSQLDKSAIGLLTQLLTEIAKGSTNAGQLLKALINGTASAAKSAPSPPLPPPPPPPPAPRPNSAASQKGPPPPAPPPLKKAPGAPVAPKQSKAEIPEYLKLKVVPPQGTKLRHLQWTKIPVNALASSDSRSTIWQRMDKVDADIQKRMDLSQLNEYFSCTPTVDPSSSVENAASQQKSHTVSLLSNKRSLSVNIFLKMYKNSSELIDHLRKGESDQVGLERLNMLLQQIPTDEEKQTLEHYSGDKAVLGAAEQFLMELMHVPDYKLRLEAMVFKEEFEVIMSNVEPDLQTLLRACNELQTSRALQKTLFVLLHMGNYLNHDAAAGNAVGFKLNSLWKINDLRAVKGGRTLLHFIAEQVGHETAEAAMEELVNVQDAAKLPFESLRSDLKSLGDRIKRLENQMKSKMDSFFEETKSFLRESYVRIVRSTETVEEIEKRRLELSSYFCEPEKTFSLEECFKIFGAFLGRFNAAAKENLQRKEREERMKANPSSAAAKEKSEDTLNSLLGSRPKVQTDLLTSSGSPAPNRRASVILEQDRNRQTFAPRRKSAFVRSDQPFLIRELSDENSNDAQSSDGSRPLEASTTRNGNSLEAFVDGALWAHTRKRSSAASAEARASFAVPSDSTHVSIPKRDSRDSLLTRDLAAKEDASLPNKSCTSGSLADSKRKSRDEGTSFEGASRPDTLPARKEDSALGLGLRRGVQLRVPKQPSEEKSEPVKRIVPSRLTAESPRVSQPSAAQPMTPTTTSSAAARRSALYRVRTKHTTDTAATPSPTAPTPAPVKPSEIRALQKQKSNATPITPTAPAKTYTTRTTPVTSTTRQASPPLSTRTTTSSLLQSRRPPLTRDSSSGVKASSPGMFSRTDFNRASIRGVRASTESPRSTTSVHSPVVSRLSQPKRPLTTSEKRQTMMKTGLSRTDSVSTASRPALIKTGSTNDRPKWC